MRCVVKLSNLLNKVEDQAIERFERRPDQVSNKELLEYMNVSQIKLIEHKNLLMQ